MNPSTRQTAFRLPPTLIARLDRYADRMMQEQAGVDVTRADVVRMLLTKALDELDKLDKLRASSTYGKIVEKPGA